MRQMQLLRDPKRLLPVLIGGVAGVFILADLLLPNQAGLRLVSAELLRWVTVIAAFAILVGVINVVTQHLRRVIQRDQRWLYSIALIIGVLIPPALALYEYLVNAQIDVTTTAVFQDMIRWVYTPLSVSILALLTFFAVTASIRAIGSGNRQAIVLIVVALVMLVVQIPLFADMPLLGESVAWVQQYVALAGLRGLVFGAAIGAIVASTRILLGLDRPYLDR